MHPSAVDSREEEVDEDGSRHARSARLQGLDFRGHLGSKGPGNAAVSDRLATEPVNSACRPFPAAHRNAQVLLRSPASPGAPRTRRIPQQTRKSLPKHLWRRCLATPAGGRNGWVLRTACATAGRPGQQRKQPRAAAHVVVLWELDSQHHASDNLRWEGGGALCERGVRGRALRPTPGQPRQQAAKVQ